MRRALLVWRKVAPDVPVDPDAAAAEPVLRSSRSGATLEQVRGIAQEYLAILAYWRRGWV